MEKKMLPRDLLEHIRDLQQTLLKDDHYIPGIKNEDEMDLARRVDVRCSSHLDGAEGLWLSFKEPIGVRKVILYFDPNLSLGICMSLSKRIMARQAPGVPQELVMDYDLEFHLKKEMALNIEERDNYLRYRVHNLERRIVCDEIKLVVKATRGGRSARVFEIRVYDSE
jgi:hypothetical protein